ncbi:mRNA-capping enzyme [Fopius arisanus]|uniref:mRNA-capping enzyme n=1 Tax=Fopius arisanus TaxID=64838 RepID=A0A0C9R0J2_9HYME|nr:PREDICTED: mRNA-capping enzyme [Fopius arisanus]XP_011307621.1 PREDICTED: mRNA-capping enzyme [Fopius arisanus]
MSRNSSDKGPVPPRWLHCPRKSNRFIADKFLAFKTPLSSDYDSQVPEENRFAVSFIFDSLKNQRTKMGLWIDLTNTSRFYDKKEVEAYGCRYLKLACRGHGETPSEDQTNTFIKICKTFIAKNPLEIIGVHCTHGFNRTGFLIISYLVETEFSDVEGGLYSFSIARPPGIYKGDYIQELFRHYSDIADAPPPPARPTWCLEYDDAGVEDTDEVPESGSSGQTNGNKRRREFNAKNPVFMAGVPNVEVVKEPRKIAGIQARVQQMCGWETGGFPGSQPVSMDKTNLRLLHEKPYRVSWKADGTRYMLLIQGDGELYFIDRNNSVFEIKGLTFPHPRDVTRQLRDTLLDGEMVIDKDKGIEYPRYLAYDVIMYDGKDVSKNSFYPDRYTIIEKEIMEGRHRAMKDGRLRREREPISVRIKQFWELTQAKSLLSEKFANMLSHEPDGLIFQPAKEPYTPGPANDVLKWKPLSMNSVDFKLKIVTESGPGILPRKIGHLFVGGLDIPFGEITSLKGCKELNNKIIECKSEKGRWVFMRERTDKSFPNSYKTARAVCASIKDPVTKEILLEFIEHNRFVDDADLMPPPKRMKHER